MANPPIIQAILDMEQEGRTLEEIANISGLVYDFLYGLKTNKYKKYRVSNVDKAYKFFNLPPDDWYYTNMMARNKRTFSVIGSILRAARVKTGYTIKEVASILKGDAQSIRRIELGDTLPSVRSYYITEMLNLYDMTDEQKMQVQRGIIILQDLHAMFREYVD